MMVLINRRKRKTQHAMIFQGWLLNERIKSLQHGATVIGTVFELCAGHLLKLDNLATNSQMDVCPDGFDSRGTRFIESKACGRGGRFLVHREQLDRYQQAAVQESAGVLYIFWAYDHALPVGDASKKRNRKMIGEVVENAVNTVKRAYILDHRVVKALSDAVANGGVDGAGQRMAVMRFHGRPEFVRNYMTISWRFLERLALNPANVLRDELKLDSSDWDASFGRCSGSRLTFNGVDFRTKAYKVFRLLERIPF